MFIIYNIYIIYIIYIINICIPWKNISSIITDKVVFNNKRLQKTILTLNRQVFFASFPSYSTTSQIHLSCFTYIVEDYQFKSIEISFETVFDCDPPRL